MHTHSEKENQSKSNANQLDQELSPSEKSGLTLAPPPLQFKVGATKSGIIQQKEAGDEEEVDQEERSALQRQSSDQNPQSQPPASVIQRDGGNSPDPAQGTPIQIPNPRNFSFAERMLWNAVKQGVSMLPGGVVLNMFLNAPEMAAATGCTIGIGITGSAGAGAGIALGTGLYFTPGGDIGVYGSGAFDNGFLFSAAAGLQVTIVGGGLDNFSGDCLAFGIAGGEVVVGGLNILFKTDMSFLGVSGMIGVGVGLPFEFYFEAQRTWTTDPIAQVEPPT